jgi:hypothetical protein
MNARPSLFVESAVVNSLLTITLFWLLIAFLLPCVTFFLFLCLLSLCDTSPASLIYCIHGVAYETALSSRGVYADRFRTRH